MLLRRPSGPSSITNASFERCTGLYGGAVAAMNSSHPLTIQASNFTGNTALMGSYMGMISFGGALYAWNASSLALQDCVFRENVARSGGAVSATDITGLLNIAGCSFSGNTAVTGASLGNGGALYISHVCGPVTVSATNFTNCSAPGGLGGGMLLEFPDPANDDASGSNTLQSVQLSGVRFLGCSSATGGGLYMAASSAVGLDMRDATFERCRGEGPKPDRASEDPFPLGGGAAVYNPAFVTAEDCLFSEVRRE